MNRCLPTEVGGCFSGFTYQKWWIRADQAGYGYNDITFDASQSSTIYKTNARVQVLSMSCKLYIKF